MTLSQDSKFAFAVGRIRVLETRLLDASRIQRMLDAKSAQEAYHILTETEYADLVAKAKEPHQFEVVTTGEITRVYEMIRKMLPKDPLVDLFCVKYDIHNLKVLLKAQVDSRDYEQILMDAGLVPLGLMKYVIKGEKLPDIPPFYYEAVERAKKAYGKTNDPRTIDDILDQEQYKILKAISDKNEFHFFSQQLEEQIDLLNIRSLIRTRRLNRGYDFMQTSLIPHGKIPFQLFKDLAEADWTTIVKKFENTQFSSLIKEGVENYLTSGQLALLEKRIDDQLILSVKKFKYTALGPEPIVGYIMAKEAEIRNIRIIMLGKLNDVPTEIIRERLRESYV